MSLLPIVSTGVFLGTAFLCGVVIFIAKVLDLSFFPAIILTAIGGISQYFPSFLNYKDTTSVQASIEHLYYSLPSYVNYFLPGFKLTPETEAFLLSPIPLPMLQIHTFAWLLSPFLLTVFGAYCLDSKNTFCCFPGAPYFCRVLRCNIASSEDKNSQKKDLKLVRDWVMQNSPPDNQSSHYWYSQLPPDVKQAFDNCANSSRIHDMFRELFSTRNYAFEVVNGMNEIYVTGPSRLDQKNSDQVFYTRHVDGPWGWIPFVSVYRCIVGMDKNFMVSNLSLLDCCLAAVVYM